MVHVQVIRHLFARLVGRSSLLDAIYNDTFVFIQVRFTSCNKLWYRDTQSVNQMLDQCAVHNWK